MTSADMPSVDAWWSSGSRVALSIGAQQRSVFVRVSEPAANKPWITLLHGFPSSSWDWHKVWPALSKHYRVLALDFLGYGASDKSRAIAYSTALHADTLLAVWKHCGVERTRVIAHDIGTAVIQEVLARRDQNQVSCVIDHVLMINGAVFIDHYRPSTLQRLLMHALTGPLIAASMNQSRFTRSVARAFAQTTQPSQAELQGFWRAMSRDDGHKGLHRLLHHIPERVLHRARWEGALRTTDVPLSFLWGVRDPFVGFVANDIRHHLPYAALHELDVGHFPQLEAASSVVSAAVAALR